MELMDLSLEKLYKTVYRVAKENFDETVLGIIGVTVRTVFSINCYKILKVLNALNDLKEVKRIIHRG